MAVVSKSDDRPDHPGFLLVGFAVALMLALALVAAWSTLAGDRQVSAMVASPGNVLRVFGTLLEDPTVWRATGATLASWFAAFLTAAMPAVALGLAAGRLRGWASAAAPSLFLFGAFPAVTLAPLGLMAYGLGSPAPAIALAALLAFFPAVAVIAHGQRAPNSPTRIKALCRGVEIAALLALSGVVFAEMLVGKDRLGSTVLESMQRFETAKMLAQVLWLWGVGVVVALPFAIVRWLAGRL